MKVCLATNHLLWNETLGGHAWVFLNWALGLKANGCDVVVLEKARHRGEPERLIADMTAGIRRFRETAERLGAPTDVALWSTHDAPTPPGVIPLEQVADECDLLLNFRYPLPQSVVDRFRRSALIDIDPGLLQHWISAGQVAPAAHDIYFSIGETVGQPNAKFPDCGLTWHFAPPPVALGAWPVTEAPEDAPYTTVTNWWGEYEVVGDVTINNEKRTTFLEMIDLPAHTDVAIELAIYQETPKNSDIPRLLEHGWRARPAHEVSATPDAYRDYIRSSRGEFSCAKKSCAHFANAWISDRTLCYLASGKPAVVQHTGPSRFLPDDDGLLRFHDRDGAAECLAAVEADYAHHAHAAHALAETHFDATKVVARVLDRARAVSPRERHGKRPGKRRFA